MAAPLSLLVKEAGLFPVRVDSLSAPSRSFRLFLFSVSSNTAGCSEPLGMKSRLISDEQLSASSTFRTWGVDTFTWHPQFARLDKAGKTNAWSPAQNNRSEWIQVWGNPSGSEARRFCRLRLYSFVLSSGGFGEDQTSHGHRHSGCEGLRGGPVRVTVQSCVQPRWSGVECREGRGRHQG